MHKMFNYIYDYIYSHFLQYSQIVKFKAGKINSPAPFFVALSWWDFPMQHCLWFLLYPILAGVYFRLVGEGGGFALWLCCQGTGWSDGWGVWGRPPAGILGGGFLGKLVVCVQSRDLGAHAPRLPRFILLASFTVTLLVVSILDIVYHCHLWAVLQSWSYD